MAWNAKSIENICVKDFAACKDPLSFPRNLWQILQGSSKILTYLFFNFFKKFFHRTFSHLPKIIPESFTQFWSSYIGDHKLITTTFASPSHIPYQLARFDYYGILYQTRNKYLGYKIRNLKKVLSNIGIRHTKRSLKVS